ncbi:MAG: hypothetical protein KDB27_28225 [Planctomycetales bacterium]|nr:hypothetical protein [Planctomycetales bacterium]
MERYADQPCCLAATFDSAPESIELGDATGIEAGGHRGVFGEQSRETQAAMELRLGQFLD